MENIRPWCVSRQLWWGHRLPVYYCDACEETYVARDAARALRRLRRSAAPGRGRARHVVLERAVAVRDARLARADRRAARLLPDRRARHRARHHLPLGRADDHDGARVHRRGPVRRRLRALRDPGARRAADVEVARAPGSTRSRRSTAAAPTRVRFGLLAMSSTQDVRYSAEKVEQGEGLANKLYNAARFVICSRRAGDGAGAAGSRPRSRTAGSSRASRAPRTSSATRIERYDFARAAQALYDFVYGELCDWYIELVKARLADAASCARRCASCCGARCCSRTRSCRSSPRSCGRTCARTGRGCSPGTVREPLPCRRVDDEQAEAALERVIAATQAVRRWRNEVGGGAGRGARRAARRARATTRRRRCSRGSRAWSCATASGEARRERRGARRRRSRSSRASTSRRTRSARERERARLDARDRARCAAKLANDAFVANAPAAVVAAEREKLARARARAARRS